MGVLSGFLRGVERSSRQWPAAIMQQKSMQEQQDQEQKQQDQEQQRLAREALGLEYQIAEDSNDPEALTDVFIRGSEIGMFPQGKMVQRKDGTERIEHPTLTALLTRNAEEEVEQDTIRTRTEEKHVWERNAADERLKASKINRKAALHDLNVAQLKFDAGEVDFDLARGIMSWQRLNPETGRYETQFSELDLPEGYEDPAETRRLAELTSEIINGASKQLGSLPTEEIMTKMKARLEVNGIAPSDKFLGQIREAASAVKVNLMGHMGKAELKALGDYRSAQSMSAGLLHKIAVLSKADRGQLNKWTGTWNVEAMKKLGGATVNPAIASLMTDLAGLLEVFARAQTGAAINAGEEERFAFLTGSGAMGPQSLQIRLAGMIAFGKRRRLGVYGSTLDNIHATSGITAGQRAGYEKNFESVTFPEEKWVPALSKDVLKFFVNEKNRITKEPLNDWAVREANRRAAGA